MVNLRKEAENTNTALYYSPMQASNTAGAGGGLAGAGEKRFFFLLAIRHETDTSFGDLTRNR